MDLLLWGQVRFEAHFINYHLSLEMLIMICYMNIAKMATIIQLFGEKIYI